MKWNLPASNSAEHRGRTPKCPIKDHKVLWDYNKTQPVRLVMDKTNLLTECLIHLEVVQEYNSGIGGRADKILLGTVSLNLSEYVEIQGDDGEEGITRRYLMQESKINSTLRVGIAMKQLDGERNFVTPPLKTAPVFGGITGIMDFEQAEQDDLGRECPSTTPSSVLAHSIGHILRTYIRHAINESLPRRRRGQRHVPPSARCLVGFPIG